ncbi:MAG: VanZ family protein [Clostridia bacterium]|nr:VanZ family protein [Clostridia bacterium]
MKNAKKARVVFILLLALWMLVIFVMSAQPAEQSSQLSGGIVSSIIAAICRNFDTLSLQQQADITSVITLIVRKTAHFSEYFILGALVSLTTLTFSKINYKLKFLLSVMFCVIYAASDEIHQFFVPGRACRFGDVFIDTAGSIIAITLIMMIYKLKNRSGEINA